MTERKEEGESEKGRVRHRRERVTDVWPVWPVSGFLSSQCRKPYGLGGHAFTFTTSHLLPALEREMKSRVQSQLYPEKAAQKPSLKQLNCPENMHLQRQIIFRKDNVMKF